MKAKRGSISSAATRTLMLRSKRGDRADSSIGPEVSSARRPSASKNSPPLEAGCRQANAAKGAVSLECGVVVQTNECARERPRNSPP